MMANKLKVLFKWAGILLVLALVINIVSELVVTIVLGEVPASDSSTYYIGPLVGVILTLPITYFIGYRAALESLQLPAKGGKKNSGIGMAVSVVGLVAIGASLVNYLVMGEFDFKLGLLPIILSIVAGRKAEKAVNH